MYNTILGRGILFCCTLPVGSEGDTVFLYFGVDADGRLLEIGLVESDTDDIVIHAMSTRTAYRRRFGV